MSVKCSAVTKAGGRCTWAPLPGKTLCLSHAGAAGDPESLEVLRQRQRDGLAKQKRQAKSRRRARVPLSNDAERMAHIESLAGVAECAKGDNLRRAQVGAALVELAQRIQEADLSRKAKELATLAANPKLSRRSE